MTRRRSVQHGFAGAARHAFTLIELLVVISIIALIVSLLLPALSGAVRVGRTTACLATLRGMSTAAISFATDNDDQIIGAPSTSGAYLNSNPMPTVAYGAAVQRWDFMGPMAALTGIDLPEQDGTNPAVARRFNGIRTHKAFLCRSNEFLSSDFSGPVAGTNRMISYNTVRWGLFIKATSASEAGFPGDGLGVSWYADGFETKLPTNYKPRFGQFGVPANKVLFADGARYSNYNTPPDHDLILHAPWGGAFSDGGPYLTLSASWDRRFAPGNSGGPPNTVDARVYAFRHSTGLPPRGAKANTFRANAMFMDGHGETQGDLDFSNPHQWLPQGTILANLTNIFPDTVRRWGLVDGVRIGP